MGSGFKPWARSSWGNCKTTEQFQCSLRHQDIIFCCRLSRQSCHDLQERTGKQAMHCNKTPQRAPWSYKPPRASSSNDKYLEVAINPSRLGVCLECPALGSFFPGCKNGRCKPGPSLCWGPPELGAKREKHNHHRAHESWENQFPPPTSNASPPVIP